MYLILHLALCLRLNVHLTLYLRLTLPLARHMVGGSSERVACNGQTHQRCWNGIAVADE